MSSVIGVCSLYQIVPADKPPHKVATSAAALVPSLSCFSLWKGVSRGRALVVFPVATRNSVPGEEVFKGLAGRFLTELPLENESVEEEDGGQFDEYGEEDEKDYGAGEADELAIANLVLPQPQLLLVDSPEKRGINHLFPSQVGDEEEKLGEDIKLYTAPTTSTSNHTVLSDLITEAMRPRSGRRPWHSSSSIGTSLAAANTVQLFPSKALAQMCGATMKQAASMPKGSDAACHDLQGLLVLMDLDPATARLASSIIGPLLSAYGFLFILRIVMSWYPKTPVGKFPYVVAYAPTEPLLILTRKLIPPLGGVDVTPVVWFGLISFLNEILVGPQGLLVLLSQQV